MSDDTTSYRWFKLTHEPPTDGTLWGAWLAMWRRVGCYCVLDYLHQTAWGKPLWDDSPHLWPDDSYIKHLQVQAREFWWKMGYDPRPVKG